MFLRRREIEQSINLLSGSMSYASAAIGDILLTDKSFATLTQWNTGGYLPAIGVIFGNASGVLRVLSLTKSAAIKWDTAASPADLSLTNYEPTDYSDLNGLTNTATIVTALGNVTTHAAGYCYNYVTDGTVAHNWYLPAYGEGKAIIDNYSTLNTTLTALGASLIKNNTDTDFANSTGEVYWCSTELYDSSVLGSAVLCYNTAFDEAAIPKNSASPLNGASLYARACLRITY